MIQYIIIVAVVLLALLAVGLFYRRKHNVIIARLEKEKLEVQHYPIYEELTKVKALNMNGQTEELFENWRNAWVEVTDVHVIKIDALLFDAEEYIDRFKFKKATEIEKAIEEKIAECEKTRLKILAELEELIGSEEKNRIEMEQLKEYHRSARKTVLAHQHSFGSALEKLEKRLEQFSPKFDEFDILTAEGNYLQAREIVLLLNTEAQEIFELLSDIPSLLSEVQTKIPTAIHELRMGQQEMEEQHYYLRHLELTEYLDRVEKELEELKKMIADLDIEKVKPRIDEINGEIDHFYDLLEKEVVAKKYVDHHCSPLRDTLQNLMVITREVSDEATYVQHSYRLPEKDAEIPRNCLKQLEVLHRRYELLAMRVTEEKSAYSSLKEELEEISEELARVNEEQENFSLRLKNLRVDENTARTQLEALSKLLQETERMLGRANIPGIPEEMDVRLEEAEEQLFIVMQSLQETPLNMEQINNNLNNAKKCIEEVKAKAEEMIENVMYIERIIQYGNRYRASNPQMHVQLREAEDAFHQCRYIKALEDAAAAVESAEPGALKRIQELMQEEMALKS
ncbi:septation ring formation regulator EzrA [Lysinibacillus sp. LZ02]|uniref:septation ring formation regulator EzrA n=1 Tax=Lysinibacillus sp. LZ02 TaxID=3420668 RepID=UPI003D36F4BD